MLPRSEQEAIAADVKAANAGVGRFRTMLDQLCLAALEGRHPDLYPPPIDVGPADPAARGRPTPPADVSGQLEWLGAHGDVAAVPELADDMMAALDDGHSGDWYDGHLLPWIAAGGPRAARLIASAYRNALDLPRRDRRRAFGRSVKRLRERWAKKTARRVNSPKSPDGRPNLHPY